MKPKRIQRKRTKGWKMPSHTIYVGRPTKWGNPFRVTDEDYYDDQQKCVDSYRNLIEKAGLVYIKNGFYIQLNPKELRGKNLACFCPLDKPCHADVLLEIANA